MEIPVKFASNLKKNLLTSLIIIAQYLDLVLNLNAEIYLDCKAAS